MQKKRYYFLYITTNLVNGKYYKGQHATDNLFDGYLGSGKALKRAIDKYGRDNFKRQIVLFLPTYEALLDAEAMYITAYDLLNKQCYNLRAGGGGQYGHDIVPYIRTETQREAISRKAVYRYKKKRSECSEYYTYKAQPRKTPVLRPSVSENHKGENNPMYGKRGTLNATSKAVYCIELDKVYGSAMLAAEELHLAFQNISKVCKGKRRTCGGYHWCFICDKDKAISSYKEAQKLDLSGINRYLYTSDVGSPGQAIHIICVETKKSFATLYSAAEYSGSKNPEAIIAACKTGSEYKDKHWMFLEDYERMTSVQHSQEQTLCNSVSPEDSE